MKVHFDQKTYCFTRLQVAFCQFRGRLIRYMSQIKSKYSAVFSKVFRPTSRTSQGTPLQGARFQPKPSALKATSATKAVKSEEAPSKIVDTDSSAITTKPKIDKDPDIIALLKDDGVAIPEYIVHQEQFNLLDELVKTIPSNNQEVKEDSKITVVHHCFCKFAAA